MEISVYAGAVTRPLVTSHRKLATEKAIGLCSVSKGIADSDITALQNWEQSYEWTILIGFSAIF